MFQAPGVHVVALEPGRQGGFAQLWADEVDVAVDAAGRGDQVFAGDHLRAGADDQAWIDPRLDQRIARFADGHDAAAADADVPLDNAPVIENDRIGDDQVQWRLGRFARKRRLALAIADDFTAAELHLFAVDSVIFFNFDNQLGVGEANAVAGRRTIMAGIGRTRKSNAHLDFPSLPKFPWRIRSRLRCRTLASSSEPMTRALPP